MNEVKKVFKLAADSINGVYEVCETTEVDTYSFEVFLDNLNSLSDDEIMYCYATESELNHLATYYHVELL